MPPSGGIPLQNRSCWSRKCPRVPRERLSNPSEGPAFEPLISNGLGARVLWRLSNPSEGPAFEPLISRRARGPLPLLRRIPFEISPFPVPVARERKGKRKRI
jgi:hypothetical protein